MPGIENMQFLPIFLLKPYRGNALDNVCVILFVDFKIKLVAFFCVHQRIAERRHLRNNFVVRIGFPRAQNRVFFFFAAFFIEQENGGAEGYAGRRNR